MKAGELDSALKDSDVCFLDIRRPEELETLGTIEGYVNIPLDELAGRLDEHPTQKAIVTA